LGSLNVKRFLVVLLFIAYAGIIFLSFLLIVSMQYSFNVIDAFTNFNSTPAQFILLMAVICIYYYPVLALSAKASISSLKSVSTVGIRVFIIAACLLLNITVYFFFEDMIIFGIDEFIFIAGYYLLFLPVMFIAVFLMFKTPLTCPEGLRPRFKKGALRFFKVLFYPGRGSMFVWFSVILALMFLAEARIIEVLNNFAVSYYSDDWSYNLLLCILLILIYSYIGVVVNGISKLFIKHKISSLKAAVFTNILMSVVAVILMSAYITDSEYLFPFYYLIPEDYIREFPLEELGWGGFLVLIIFINLIIGIVFFIKQIYTEKSEISILINENA
jgi:hypothetical protein